MKKSAFNLDLIIILLFTGLAALAHFTKAGSQLTPFFGVCAITFLIILPACSKTN